MKTRIITLALFICTSTLVYAQSELRWRSLPSVPQTSRMMDLSFINSNSGWAITQSRVYKTQDGGNTWITFTDTSFGALRSIGFADSLNGWLGTLHNLGTKLYRTTNGGLNWIKDLETLSDSLGICGISVVDKNIVYACGRYYGAAYLYKTTNGGINWVLKNMQSYASTLIDCHFFNKDSGYVAGGIGNFPLFIAGVILFTSDGGETWVEKGRTTASGQWCWKISFPDRNNGFVSLEKDNPPVTFFKTTDGGETWSEYLFSTIDRTVQGIGFINQNTGWIGGHNFYNYKTTDGGQTWSEDPWGMTLNRIRILSDTLAYAAGQTIYKFSRDSISGITLINNSIPENFYLHQSYPNPFNPVTKIKFDITSNVKGQTSKVKLIIYDALGREINLLVNEKLSAGSYEVEFDGSNLTSGIYFYKLEVGDFSETKRMMLLK